MPPRPPANLARLAGSATAPAFVPCVTTCAHEWGCQQWIGTTFMTRRCKGCGNPIFSDTENCDQACANTAKNARPIWETFFSLTKRAASGCIEWQGAHTDRGYGKIGPRWQGAPSTAHRASFEMQHGPIPDGFCVLHRCDNPSCVNPHHLFLGTFQDNSDDMMMKGRSRQLSGEDSPVAKLTEGEVQTIRKSNKTQRALAQEFAVSKSLIGRIVRGEVWRKVA